MASIVELSTNRNDIRRAAYRILARRDHSEAELFRKLKLKKFDTEEILLVIQALIQEGMQSNERFVENYIHYRRQKGYGPIRIRNELIERGITEDLIEDQLKSTDNIWHQIAQTVLKKRFKKGIASDYKTHAQQMRFLLYRGFTQEQINRVFHDDNPKFGS